jgi:hypothetical protein
MTRTLGAVVVASTLLASVFNGSVAAQSPISLTKAAYFVVNLHY